MSRLVDLVSVAREVRLEPLRQQLSTRIPIYLVPGDPRLEQQLMALLRPSEPPRQLPDGHPPEPSSLAVHVVYGEASPQLHAGLLPLLWEGRLISIRVGRPPSYEGTVLRVPSLHPDVFQSTIAPRMLELYPDMPLALAGSFEGLKDAVAQHLIRSTALANAQLAIVASLPAFLPLLGALLSLSSELVVLTKNQILLVYKLALIHGHGQDGVISLLPELASVVVAAFGWRYLARRLVSLLPTPLSLLPKAGVAYAATYAVGTVADYYFATGRMPAGAELARLRRGEHLRFNPR